MCIVIDIRHAMSERYGLYSSDYDLRNKLKNFDDMVHYARSTIHLLETDIYAFARLSLSMPADIAFPLDRYISSISSLETIDPRE